MRFKSNGEGNVRVRVYKTLRKVVRISLDSSWVGNVNVFSK